MKNGKWRTCRKMKNSGIEWLGEVPEGWSVDRIASLYTHRNEKVSDRDYAPLSVTMKGILPQLETAAKTDDGDNRKRVCKGDFAINSRSDRRGACGISSYEGSVSLINTILSPRESMDPGYYNWLFHTASFADEYYKWGHGIVDDLWTTRWSEMKRISIVRPPLPEQRKIAAYLDRTCAKIDEIVAGTKQTIEEYKAWKASLIFEAVTGKCRIENGKCRMGGRKMRDSGIPWLGEVPEGWNTLRLRFLCDITTGDSDTQDASPEGKYPFYVRSPIIERSNHFTFEGEGVLMAGDGAGAGRIFHEARGKYAVHQRVYIMYNFRKIIMRLFKYYISVSFPHVMDGGSAQSTVPSVRLPMLQNLLCVVPPHLDQLSIVEYLDKRCGIIDRVIAEKEALIADLEAYRKSLIFEVVTGKRSVGENGLVA